MKKIHLIALLPLLLLSTLTVSSCNNETKASVIISEVVTGSGQNCAIELYNLSSKEVDLSKYHLNIRYNEDVQRNIKFDTKLGANKTYVIVNSNATEELLNKADLVSEELLFNGRQNLILYKGKSQQDIVGMKGYYSVDLYSSVTLSRKAEYLIGRKEFDEYDWIRYNVNNFKYLNTIEVSISEKELLDGPKLTPEDHNAPFSYMNGVNRLGGGGTTLVTIESYVDGDTTFFNFEEEEAREAEIPHTSKVRYQNIDTPESYTGNIQEFGLVAKDYTKNELKKAGIVYIQSVKDGQLFETFDRVLGWVWADGKLMNHKIVKAGYSYVAFGSIDNMLYKDVSYTNFLYDAMLYAQKNKLGLHGEVDPYWDYDNNCVKPGNQGSEK